MLGALYVSSLRRGARSLAATDRRPLGRTGRPLMAVVRIAVYPIDASKVDELQDSVDSSLIPLYRQQPGCQALSLTHCGDSVVSVTR